MERRGGEEESIKVQREMDVERHIGKPKARTTSISVAMGPTVILSEEETMGKVACWRGLCILVGVVTHVASLLWIFYILYLILPSPLLVISRPNDNSNTAVAILACPTCILSYHPLTHPKIQP